MKKISLLLFVFAACAAKPITPPGPPALPLATNIIRRPLTEAFSKNFMISTDGEAASKAGARMLAQGGNAVDAAVASSFTISVERPHSTGLGGGGFLLLHLAKGKKTLAFDFRERAPLSAHKDMYLNENRDPVPKLSQDTALAAGVPGLVAGLVEVHRRFGKLPLAKVLEPAIELAENGFPVYPAMSIAFEDRKAVIAQYPATAAIFLKADGSTYKVGETLVQKDLAKTLREIARHGARGFYKGWVANAIVKTVGEHKGLITQQDLDIYKVKQHAPVTGTFQGHEIASMTLPSSGGAHVIQILNIIENDPLAQWGAGSAQSVHLFSSAMQRAFADRAEYLGDPEFVDVPIKGIISKKYAASLRAQIPEANAKPSTEIPPGRPMDFQEPDHTTHLNVMDKFGNTVATTQTINGWMGSGLVAEGTGVLMNNEMDDFAIKPGVANLFGALGGDKNAIAPKKTPLSSMSPTILFKDGKPVMALGSPSGTRIITCVAQVIANRVTHGMPLYEAVSTIRYHHQWAPDEIRVDSPGFPAPLKKDLEGRGYKIKELDLGCRIAAIEAKDGMLHGVADPRGEGIALGE
jgi:gamma-glutamyltranspeptidase/glutathione hydrolase